MKSFGFNPNSQGAVALASQIILSILACTTVASVSPHYNNNHYLAARRKSATTSSFNKSYKKELNTINSWNFRSLSSLHLSAAQPNPATSDGRKRRRLPYVVSDGDDTTLIDDISKTSSSSSSSSFTNNRRTFGRRRRTRRTLQGSNDNKSEFKMDHDVNSSNSNHNMVTLTNRGKLTDDEYEEDEYPQSIEEFKANLGPVALLVANSIEVGMATAGSYISGFMFGYIVGGVMGVPTLFQKGAGAAGSLKAMNANHNALKEFQRRMGNLNSKAFTQSKSWASLSASCSGFNTLTRVCRGGVEDRWNTIIGCACAGAYQSRHGEFFFSSGSFFLLFIFCFVFPQQLNLFGMMKAGPQAMLNAASTYAGFTYILDMVFGSSSNSSTGLNKEFDFTDTPIEERGY